MGQATAHTAGQRFNYFMLTGKSYEKMYGGAVRKFVECICDCGTIKFTLFQDIRRNIVVSCGCKKRSHLISINTKHGFAARANELHPLYTTWVGMKSRCYTPSCIGYKNYGGKGITVCSEWRDNFETFYNWALKNGWEEGLTIERINGNKNYDPTNCKCDNYYNQARNKSNNNNIDAFGETKCITDWANDKRCNVSYGCLHNRIMNLEISPEVALSTPPFKLSIKLSQ